MMFNATASENAKGHPQVLYDLVNRMPPPPPAGSRLVAWLHDGYVKVNTWQVVKHHNTRQHSEVSRLTSKTIRHYTRPGTNTAWYDNLGRVWWDDFKEVLPPHHLGNPTEDTPPLEVSDNFFTKLASGQNKCHGY